VTELLAPSLGLGILLVEDDGTGVSGRGGRLVPQGGTSVRRYALAVLVTALLLPLGHASAQGAGRPPSVVGPDRRAPAAAEVVEPNFYQLAGEGLRVTYLTEGGRGQPQPTLRYRDGSRVLLFTGDEIRTEETELGRLVTVTIRLRVDVDSTTFTLVVPHVNLGPGNQAAFRTIGITTVHHQPFAPEPPVGPVEKYRVTRLRGTAEYVAF
jgi:hypothetical protein